MNRADNPFYILLVIISIAGVVLAKGVWSTIFCIFFPPWAWYLVIEAIMKAHGYI